MIWIVALGLFFISGIIGWLMVPKLLDFAIENSQNRGFFNGPWKTHLGVGLKSTSAIEKAAICRIGLGGNSSKETVYWNVFTDSDGNVLSTNYNYEVIITNPLPINYENHGFWSITAYGEDQYLMHTSFRKYMVRHNDFEKESYPLKIMLGTHNVKNYPFFIPLSTEKQKFILALRCYRPSNEMLNYTTCVHIHLPEIRRIE